MYPRCVLLLFIYHIVTGMSLPATYDQRQTGDLNVQVHLKDVQVLALLDSELLDDYTVKQRLSATTFYEAVNVAPIPGDNAITRTIIITFIFAGNTEYDYFYDYADFTVKPIVKPTTSTSTTIESVPSASDETTEKVDVSGTPDSSSINSTVLSSTNGTSNANSTTEDTIIPVSMIAEKINETTAVLSTDDMEELMKMNDTSKGTVNKTEDFFIVNEDSIQQTFTKGPLAGLLQKRCRNGYSRDGKGRCRRPSQRRLSLIPLAIKLAPKLLDDLARSTKNLAQEEVHRMHSN